MITAIFADGDFDVEFEDGSQKEMAEHIVWLQEQGFVVKLKRFKSYEEMYDAIDV